MIFGGVVFRNDWKKEKPSIKALLTEPPNMQRVFYEDYAEDLRETKRELRQAKREQATLKKMNRWGGG